MDDRFSIGWVLLFVGLAIAALGVLWIVAPSVPWLGRLPGDVYVERGPVRFYFPLVTCLLLSLLLSLLFWLVRLFGRQS